MSDQKFQLRYSATEDRVFVISGNSRQGLRSFALTRRMIRQLWPGLNRVITQISPSDSLPAEPIPDPLPETSAAPTSADAAQGSAAVAEIEGSPVQPARSENPAVPSTHHLVLKLQLVDRGDEPRLLVLSAKDAALRVPLDDTQLAQIYEALRTVIERADWTIDLDEGLPDASAAPPTPTERNIDITADSPSRYRH